MRGRSVKFLCLLKVAVIVPLRELFGDAAAASEEDGPGIHPRNSNMWGTLQNFE